MAVSGQKIDGAEVGALFAAGNSNPAIARYYAAHPLLPFVPYTTGGTPNRWFTELCRLRSDMDAAAHWYKNGTSGDPLLALWEAVVSGPWPINGPHQFYDRQEFYYADRGQAEWVRLQSNFNFLSAVEYYATWYHGFGVGGGGGSGYYRVAVDGYAYRQEKYTLIVGGNENVKIEAVFTLRCKASTGNEVTVSYGGGTIWTPQLVSQDAYTTALADMVSLDSSGWISGATWNRTLADNGHGYNITYTCRVDAWVAPGRYELLMLIDVGGDCTAGGDDYSWRNPARGGSGEVAPDSVSISGLVSGQGLAYLVNTAATPVAGIHKSKAVLKIPAPLFNNSTNDPPLVGMAFADGAAVVNPVVFGDDFTFGLARGFFWPVGYTTSLPGLWTGKVPPVGSLNNVDPNIMPWNMWALTSTWNPIGGNGGGGFDSNGDTENSLTTPPWKEQTLYPVDFCVLDQCGFRWRCTVAGFSGLGQVQWPTIKSLLPLVAALPANMTPGFNTYTEPGHRPDDNPAKSFRAGPTWALDGFNLPVVARWQAGQTYTVGDKVLDHHGNTQQLVAVLDVAGQPTTAASGISGTQETYSGVSIWKILLGEFSLDPNGGNFTFLKWELTAVNIPAFTPAKARSQFLYQNLPGGYTYSNPPAYTALGMPRYPFIWFNDIAAGNVPLLYPAGTFPVGRWSIGFEPWTTSNPSFIHWIHRVFINRLGVVGAAGIAVKQAGEIAVEIGCMRNGAFVSFGMYQTGTMVEALWPIFTSDFLVYKAGERVDLQATIIGSMNSRTDGSWGVDPIVPAYPICAHYVNDTVALLAKLV